MSERPIIFSAPMIRALLGGRKTQTRRVLKPQPPSNEHIRARSGASYGWWRPDNAVGMPFRPVGPVWAVREAMGGEPLNLTPPHEVGDRIWVRETFRFDAEWDDCKPADFDRADAIHYDADGDQSLGLWGDPFTLGRTRSPIHMPRWASRLTLIVTDVRVQRVQDISEADAIAEGAECDTCIAMQQSACRRRGCPASKVAFQDLWNSIHGPEAWDRNDWVAAYTFTVHKQNIDKLGDAA